MSSLKPCAAGGCGVLVTRQAGRCELHKIDTGWSKWQRGKGNTTERGYGHAWRKVRGFVMMRDKHLCQVCKASGRLTPATEVDHVVSKARGGSDDPSNLRGICRKCHATKTGNERLEQRN